MQVIIVSLIVAAAAAYIIRSMYKSAKGNACETGNCGCNTATTKPGKS